MGSLSKFTFFLQRPQFVLDNGARPREHQRVNADSGLPTWFTLDNAQFCTLA